MSRKQVWTVTWIDFTPDEEGDDRGVMQTEVVRDRASLEAKIIAIGPTDFVVVPGEPLTITVDTSPRISIESAPKKPRAKRSDAGKKREPKSEPTS